MLALSTTSVRTVFDSVELVMAFEEEFGCDIHDDAAETIITVGDATKFLKKPPKARSWRRAVRGLYGGWHE